MRASALLRAVAGLAALQPDHAERMVDGVPETVPAPNEPPDVPSRLHVPVGAVPVYVPDWKMP